MKPVRELLQEKFPEPEWVIEGLIRRGKSYLLIGPPKEGKSYLALSLAVAVAMGGKAFGSLEVTQGATGYLCLEDGKEELQERLFQLAGRETRDIPGFDYQVDWNRSDEGGIDDLAYWLRTASASTTATVTDDDGTEREVEAEVVRPGPVLVVVDILQKIRPSGHGKKSVYELDYEALEPLTKLAHDMHCAIVVIHHTNKKSEEEDLLQTISGSNALAGAVDGVIGLRVKESRFDSTEFGRLQIRSRGQKRTEYELERNDYTGGWAIVDKAKSGITRECREILEVLAAGGKWKPADVGGAIGKDPKLVSQRLWQYARAGLVKREGYGNYEITIAGLNALGEGSTPVHVNGNKEVKSKVVKSEPSQLYDFTLYSHDSHFPALSDSPRSTGTARRFRARQLVGIVEALGTRMLVDARGIVAWDPDIDLREDLIEELGDLHDDVRAELQARGAQ